MSASVPTDPWREPRSRGPYPSGDGNVEGTAKGPSRKQRRRKSGPMLPGQFSGSQQSNAGRGIWSRSASSNYGWCVLSHSEAEQSLEPLASSSPTESQITKEDALKSVSRMHYYDIAANWSRIDSFPASASVRAEVGKAASCASISAKQRKQRQHEPDQVAEDNYAVHLPVRSPRSLFRNNDDRLDAHLHGLFNNNDRWSL
jgi:hypothetical protein